MPNPRTFLNDFKIHINTQIPDVQLLKVKIGHDVIERFQKYQFPLTIKLKITNPSVTSQEALTRWENHIQGHRKIYSQYGNPYDCFIEKCEITPTTQDDSIYIITCMGYGNRIPTKKGTSKINTHVSVRK